MGEESKDKLYLTIYKDLAQPTVNAIGRTLGTVAELCPTLMLPIKLINEKTKIYFEKNIKDYAKKLEEIPEEKLRDVHPQIGVPILEKLLYTSNEEIANLFTNLLKNASNEDTIKYAHPSFIDMISWLSPDEARIIEYLSNHSEICYCNFRLNFVGKGNGFKTLIDHGTILTREINLNFPENIGAYLNNLIRIGVLSDENGLYKTDETEYSKICEYYDLEKLKLQYPQPVYEKIDIDKSFYKVTNFGKLFINACIR